jgi:bacteriocin-like protein
MVRAAWMEKIMSKKRELTTDELDAVSGGFK